MEYNKELIEYSLKIWGFDINTIELEKIRHIPMHQYKISNQGKTLLYIENFNFSIKKA